MSEHLQPDIAEPVDLTNCDREPIHILGHVQFYGCLIAISADWMITHASENCAALLDLPSDKLIGRSIADILPRDSVHHLRTQMQILNHQASSARLFAFPIFEDKRCFDVSIHQGQNQIILEFEPRDGPARHVEDASAVQALIPRIQRHKTIEKMSQEAARGLKLLSGFDRVMVYRFEEDDSGTVIAEAREPDMEPFEGLRYPASDIPKQARALYLRSPLRIIADVDGQTHPIQPERDPNGAPLDLSLAVTRAVSPIHLEYLRNMGVGASLSVSIIRGGKLWGLFACHHRTGRYIDFEKRTALELFAQLFNYELAQTAMNVELADLDRARALHDALMSQLSSGSGIVDVFDRFAGDIAEVIAFDGAAIYSEGQYRAVGSAPTQEEFMGLARFLNTTPSGQIYATDRLVSRYDAAESFQDRAAGLLALPISRTPRDYLVLFRREIAKSVNWAGNPDKPVEIGPNGVRLTPRKSFEAWKEVVHGQSMPWKTNERRAADALRVTLLEVVLKLADESNAARKRAQDQQELLIAELNHRVRNILSLIRGLVSQSNGDSRSLETYRSVLDARIHALARAHDQLTEKEWDWVPLAALIETEVSAFLSNQSDRIRTEGDQIELTPAAFTTLALVMHELVTNSAKYGALMDSSGSVNVSVELNADGTAQIAWREIGGPPVKPPKRKGFGTTIIEHSIPYELKGTVDTRYRMTGFEAHFTLPASHVRKAAPMRAAEAAPLAPGGKTVTLAGNALVIEDNMIIALDAVDLLTELGAQNVVTANSVAQALEQIDAHDICFALVDVNLGPELSTPVVERLRAEGIPHVLATGYGASNELQSQFPGAVILRKPYTIDSLRAVLPEVQTDSG